MHIISVCPLFLLGDVMFKNKWKKIILPILISILVISALIPIFINLGKKNDKEEDYVVITDTDLSIVDYKIEFAQNTHSIELLNGNIKTTVRVDNVFINVNGVGVCDLTYSQSATIDGCYMIIIKPISSILNTSFGDDTRIVADIYVKYANRSHKVCSKDIDVKSCWTPFY